MGVLFCTCEFFACLDEGNILSDLIFGFNKEYECIVFVIDTTGSMGSEIAVAKRIILEFVRIEEHIGEFGCYVLVPFNDVGLPKQSKVILDRKFYVHMCSHTHFFIQVLVP